MEIQLKSYKCLGHRKGENWKRRLSKYYISFCKYQLFNTMLLWHQPYMVDIIILVSQMRKKKLAQVCQSKKGQGSFNPHSIGDLITSGPVGY